MKVLLTLAVVAALAGDALQIFSGRMGIGQVSMYPTTG